MTSAYPEYKGRPRALNHLALQPGFDVARNCCEYTR